MFFEKMQKYMFCIGTNLVCQIQSILLWVISAVLILEFISDSEVLLKNIYQMNA